MRHILIPNTIERGHVHCIIKRKKKKNVTTGKSQGRCTCASSFKCQLSLSYSLFPPFSFAILFTLQTSRNEQEISRGSYSFLHFYLGNNSLQSYYKQNHFKVELSHRSIHKYQNFKYSDIHSPLLHIRIRSHPTSCYHPNIPISNFRNGARIIPILLYIDETRTNPSLPRSRSTISADSSAPLVYLMNLSSRRCMPRQVSTQITANCTRH